MSDRGGSAKRKALRSIVFKDRFDDEGQLIYSGDTCYLCQGKIDLKLPPNLPGSPEMDDVVPVSMGGNPLDPENLRPTHKICNGRKSDRPAAVALREEAARRMTSRVW